MKADVKRIFAAICVLLLFSPLVAAARVVINEVCYDPVGTDYGREWIELYNAGDEPIELTGAKILSGGSSFSLDYVFPFFILRPGRFVLVGGDQVPNCQFTHNFRFQNGGGATDGIRFESANGSYTDTVLYDFPNLNELTDDRGEIGSSFAPDVPQGYSLARICDGFDTDDSGYDFRAEPQPSPGISNPRLVDYGVRGAEYLPEQHLLSFWVVNNSIFPPRDYARLLVSHDLVIYEAEIPPLAGLDSTYIEVFVSEPVSALKIEIQLENDPNPDNNFCTVFPQGMQLQNPVINEVFPAPLPGKQEWIELYLPLAAKNATEYTILDATGNRCRFSVPAFPGYYVICSNSAALVQDYPDCPPEKVLQSSGWASLNNDGDTLYLYQNELLLDEMSYQGWQVQKGSSLERFLNSDNDVIWRISQDPCGASPGRANSYTELAEQTEKLKIIGSPFNPKLGEELFISYQLEAENSRLRLDIFDLKGRKMRNLANNVSISARGEIIWDGKKSDGSYVPRGVYVILWQSQASTGAKIYKKQLTAAVR